MSKLIAGLFVLVAATCLAQEYPSRPVRLITPWPPGGGTDIAARLIAAKLSETWGQQVVVENKPGATGTLGTDIVAKSSPDGYTLVIGTNATHVIAVNLLPKLPYNQDTDLTPITRVLAVPHVVAVHPSVQATNVAELAALSRRDAKLAFGSAGNGSTPHLAGELFKQITGAQLLHVPYKGTGQSLQDTIGGSVQVSFDTLPSVLPHIRSGKLRALAIAGPVRVASLPGIPTVAEAGAPGSEGVTWYGIFAPSGTSLEIVRKIHRDVSRVVELPDVLARFETLGAAEIGSPSPGEFGSSVRVEVARYAAVIKAAGLKID